MFYNNMYEGFGIISLLYIIPCCLIAIWIHEFFYRRQALKLGAIKLDGNEGVSKNPFKYIDVVGCILMITTGYGWSKKRETNVSKLSKGEKVKLYLSGSIANLLFSLATLVFQSLLLIVVLYAKIESTRIIEIIQMFLNVLVRINLVMFLSQLLPIPGFAGYNILKTLFFEKANGKFITKAEQNGHTIFVIAVFALVFFYCADLPVAYLYDLLANIQEAVVDFLTGGRLSAWIS